jgi:uncharacterized protein (TIGR02611 family)
VKAHVRAIRIRAATAPGGRSAVKLAVAIVGSAVVLLGLALVPLPGPGWLIVFGGLAILSIEFVWARRLLDWVRARVQAWTRWVANLHWLVRITLGLAVLGVLVIAAWFWIKYEFGFDNIRQFWDYVTTH